MKKLFNNIKLYIGILSLLAVASCAPELDGFQPTAGQADFSKYIAVGNSLTAGYADGGLYREGQQVAYPNLIAEQLAAVGGGTFRSPLFSESEQNGSGYLQLTALVDGQPVLEQVTTALAIRGTNPNGNPLYTKYTDEIENLGVPGMRIDMATQYGIGTVLGNPFFERLLPDDTSPTMTYSAYASSKQHTFFSFWLGNNDVLGYAMNGAVTEADDATTVLTSLTVFETEYRKFINELTQAQQKGVIATIPDVTSIPYFTTVTRAALIAGINKQTGANVQDIYIMTGAGTPRAATDEDLFVLPFSSAGLLGSPDNNGNLYGLHPLNPVESKYVLDTDEISSIKAQVAAYNKIIKAVASEKSLALADAHAYLNRVKSPGIVYNGVEINASFITGNAFSLDGVHLTPMGNALIANLFIDAINAQYSSKLTKVDVALYRGVKFP